MMSEGPTPKDEAKGLGPGRLTSSFAVVVAVPEERRVITRYAVAVGLTLVSLAATFPLASLLQRVIFVLFWPAVIGAAWFGGFGPAVLASSLSVLFADYFLIGPPGQLTVGSADDLIPLSAFLFASTAVAMMTNAARSARRTAADAASRNA